MSYPGLTWVNGIVYSIIKLSLDQLEPPPGVELTFIPQISWPNLARYATVKHIYLAPWFIPGSCVQFCPGQRELNVVVWSLCLNAALSYTIN